MEIKQDYFDFWEQWGYFAHTCVIPIGGYAYKSAFYNALSLAGRLSFCGERGRTVWIGPGATLTACAALSDTEETFSVYTTIMYVDFPTNLTGLG